MSRYAAASLARYDDALMPVPDDFRSIYVALGKEKLEEYYGVRKTTMLRWLSELDEGMLKRKRRQFVRDSRTRAATARKIHRIPKIVAKQDRVQVDPELAAMAAHFLRCVRVGGWIVSPTQLGDWRVGMMVKSPRELVEMAQRKGFDVTAANLQLEAQRRVA